VSDAFQIDPADLLRFREATREEVRQLFTESQQEFPSETFFVLGLQCYCDWGTPALFYGASTLQHWKKAATEHNPAHSKTVLTEEYFKWCYGSWKCNDSLSSTNIIYEIIEKTGLENIDDDDEADLAREEFELAIEVEMMIALRELDIEGFWGQREQRNSLVLAVLTCSDDGSSSWLYEVSACLLNPEDVFRKFFVEYRRGYREEVPDMDAYIQKIRDDDLAQRFYQRLGS
jgi:hypothetical protein